MGEWKRNKRRTNGFPRGLEGKTVEARYRDGEVFTGVVGEHDYLREEFFNTADGCDGDVMAYRIIEDDQELTQESHAHTFGIDGDTTAPTDGWPEDRIDVIGQNGNTGEHYDDFHLGIKRPDGEGFVKYNAGDVVNLDGVVSIDFVSGNWPDELVTSDVPEYLEFSPNDPGQIAWYRLNYADKIDTSPEHVENEAENVHVDMVNEPPHYKQGDVECIDAIRAALTDEEWRGYCKGNALKYIWRERHKGGDESLQKAIWYLNRLVK